MNKLCKWKGKPQICISPVPDFELLADEWTVDFWEGIAVGVLVGNTTNQRHIICLKWVCCFHNCKHAKI